MDAADVFAARLVAHFRLIGIPEDDGLFRDYLAAALTAYAEQARALARGDRSP